MKQVFVLALGLALLTGPSIAGDKPELKNEKEKAGYSVGYQMGSDFRRQGMEMDPDMVAKGFRDALAGTEPLMTPNEMHQTLGKLQEKMIEAQEKEQEEQGKKNKAEGETFLAENAKKKGVKTLPSGMQYQVLKEGEGTPPKATDTVTVQYRGTLIDGTEFDSSYRRGQPATFPLNKVIKGWTEGLQLMKPGAKYRFFIPPDLAYGPRGVASKIGPESTLIFEVELLSVGGAAPPPGASGKGK